MGEIKSTLDLVMERTRHLTLSDEEKARQHKEAFDKRLQGVLQQYADGALTVEAALERIDALQAEFDRPDRSPLAAAIVARIDPDRDEPLWLALVSAVAPQVRAPLVAALNDYRRQREAYLQAGGVRMRERLAGDHGIGGSAVVPNPLKDSNCLVRLDALKQQVRRRLEAISDEGAATGQT